MMLLLETQYCCGNKMWENGKGKASEIFPHFIPTNKKNSYF